MSWLKSPTRRDVAYGVLSASIAGLTRCGFAFHSRDASSAFDAVRSRVREAIEDGKATGVAVAVVRRGEMLWEEGFGWANTHAKRKVTPRTPFSLASITKPFTTTTLTTLAAEGKIALDERANRYLGENKLSGLQGDAAEVTVRQLGAHVSGLPGMFESYDTSEAQSTPSADALLRSYGRLAYPPARSYEYSNIGFAALEAIAVNVAGISFGQLMQQRVLSPLGMSDSVYAPAAHPAQAAVGYDPLHHPIPFYTTSTPASGELYASVHDLARFAIFTMNPRVADQKRVLAARWIQELTRPVFTGPSGVATTFGWFTGRMRSGIPFLFKGGGQAGVANIMYLVPSQELACIVLTNQSNTKEFAYGVCDQAMQMFLPDWEQPQEYSGFQPAPFVASQKFRGLWQGTLENCGAELPVALQITSSSSASFSLGRQEAARVTEVRSEGEAFTGKTTGRLDARDALRTNATALNLKLVPRGEELVGRLFAEAGDPNFKNVRLPFVLRLSRSAD